jgi:hypothetical protein
MWINILPYTIKSVIFYSMSEAHSKASLKRVMKLTKEERSARARLMARARWDKLSKKKRVEYAKNVLVPAQSRFKNK